MVWRGRRYSIYLKMVIKKICLSREKMVVSILVVDVCDEVGLIYLRIDIVVLMRLKIVVFVCS